MNYIEKQKYFTKGICCILILNLVFLSVGCGGYRNVRPDSKLSKVQIGMGTQQVIDLMGNPDDIRNGRNSLNEILYLPLYLLVIGFYWGPPLVNACYYYKGEGRVYFDDEWGAVGVINYRVTKVEGDPTEDGYK